MKSVIKKVICFLLVLTITVSCVAAFASASTERASISSVSSLSDAAQLLNSKNQTVTDCNGDCGISPVIIVPGIMQSQVYVQDGNGNDLLTVDGFPIVEGMDMSFMIDTESIKESIPGLVFSLVKSVIFWDREFFLDDIMSVFADSFKSHNFNPDSTRVNDVKVDEYWYSLEECKNRPEKSYNYAKGYSKDENGNTLPTTKYPTEYDFIKRQINIEEFCNVAGYDHTYYFSYSSFGDTLSIAENLNIYIDMVKEQTGHEKVSLVFISLGGTIGNTYLSKYCDPSEIDRVVFAAAALNGSDFLADLMDGSFTLNNPDLLYTEFVPELLSMVGMNKWYGYAANILLRAIPQKVFTDLAQDALQRLSKEVLQPILLNCPSMWALVPSERYPSLSEKYISDEAHAKLKAKTDEYYNIQKNAKNTLQKLSKSGMDIFVICGYNLSLPSVVTSYSDSSDAVIQTSSESLGATTANYGEKLSDSYIPSIDKSYISPDGNLDAGTCALPEKTWFIKNQSHYDLQSSVNDVIGLCVEILLNKDIKDSRVNNGGYPQFNEYRNLDMIESMISTYKALTDEDINATNATEEQKAELKNAYNEMITVYNKTAWSYSEALSAEKRMYTIMYDLSLLPNMGSQSTPYARYEQDIILDKIFSATSNALYSLFGNNDYYLFS